MVLSNHVRLRMLSIPCLLFFIIRPDHTGHRWAIPLDDIVSNSPNSHAKKPLSLSLSLDWHAAVIKVSAASISTPQTLTPSVRLSLPCSSRRQRSTFFLSLSPSRLNIKLIDMSPPLYLLLSFHLALLLRNWWMERVRWETPELQLNWIRGICLLE